MMERVQAAAERRLSRIEAALRGIEGLRVEQHGGRVTARGHNLRRRLIEDSRLRFLASGR